MPIFYNKDTLLYLSDINGYEEYLNTTNLKEMKEDLTKEQYHLYDIISACESILDDIEDNVYLFGAHVFSQTLLNFGIDENSIVSILDNDTKKQGKRLYGTNLTIQSPEVLRDVDSPTVILRAGVYTEEIKDQILNINSTTRFV